MTAPKTSASTSDTNAVSVGSSALFAPCPFCGGYNIRVWKMTPLGVTFLVAQCKGKDCKVEMSQGMDLKIQPEEFWRSRLTERWNRRANAEVSHGDGSATPTTRKS